jgi:PhnB protein
MSQTITPYLLYEDAAGAIDFLTRAFGFRERMRIEDGGKVGHAELALGDGEIYLGQPGGDYKSPKRLGLRTTLVHVYVDDVDNHFERAKAAGAEITDEPADQEYGDRRYSALDPEGIHWFFAQRVRDVAPEEYGATVAS